MYNDTYYPTPDTLIKKMIEKVDFKKVKYILEPSAGKGAIVDWIKHHKAARTLYTTKEIEIDCIEIEGEYQSILRGNGHTVIDSDFLTSNINTLYDLIIANFPFDNGVHHALKAISMLEQINSGQIVFLINAETLKNAYSNDRKRLAQLLEKHNADIEYIENAFACGTDAERKTDVEVAMVYIHFDGKIEDLIIDDLEIRDDHDSCLVDDESTEVVERDEIKMLVAQYNKTMQDVKNVMIQFYKSKSRIGKYLNLLVVGEEVSTHDRQVEMGDKIKGQLRRFTKEIKREYWGKVLKVSSISQYLPKEAFSQLMALKERFHSAEFTESNIMALAKALVAIYPDSIGKSINYIFEQLTSYAVRDHRWRANEYEKSIHYYNAWKTNSGYKVAKKVIMPFYSRWDYWDCSISYEQRAFLDELERIFMYLDGVYECIPSAGKSTDTYKKEFGNKKLPVSKYFTVRIYKKGTIHIEFTDEALLRRFNIFVAKSKGWLPYDYASKPKDAMNAEDMKVANAFDGDFYFVDARAQLSTFKLESQEVMGIGFDGVA